ncbi:MAG TPA: alpha/beta hydrolase [Pirellulales bacterium]
MRQRWGLAVLAAIVCGLAPAATYAQTTTTVGDVKITRDVEYAKVGDQSLKLDYATPAAAKSKPPLVVWIHGGGWVGGNRANPPVAFLINQGYALASISYRFSDKAVYPAQIHDCKGAIRYLRANAEKIGFDPERIGVAGGSAGGHLVALLGTTAGEKELEGEVGGNLDQSSRVQAVCDIYGPSDLLLDETNGGEKWNPAATELVRKLLGGPRLEKSALAKLASPVYFVSEDDAPFLIIHGDKDDLVYPSQSTRLLKALQEAKVPAELDLVKGAGHGGPQFGEPSRRDRITKFFDAHLKSSAK